MGKIIIGISCFILFYMILSVVNSQSHNDGKSCDINHYGESIKLNNNQISQCVEHCDNYEWKIIDHGRKVYPSCKKG